MLSVEHVSLSLNGVNILEDVSFTLHKGKILGLIGPNGAGKTSLIRAINGAVNIDHGKIFFKKQNISSLSVQERARLIATVPQNRSVPAGFEVRQIVSMGRTPYLNWFGKTVPQDEKIIKNAMQRTNVLKLADKLAEELSGGEQQRVILARAFAQNASLLLLDEPTTHLDIHYQMEFLDLLLEHVKEEKTSVIIALHDLNQALRFCDEILLLSQGRIFAGGKPKKVLTEEKLSEVYQYPIRIRQSEDESPAFIYPKY
ncbi:MAG: ABC transporter ATP-binding protein [Chloroflexi bacterium]|nr:ABC transporter ATP-binding protein [Chloroflexota bacterium]